MRQMTVRHLGCAGDRVQYSGKQGRVTTTQQVSWYTSHIEEKEIINSALALL